MCVRIFTIGLLFISSEEAKVEIGVEIGGFTRCLRERVVFFFGVHLGTDPGGPCTASRH